MIKTARKILILILTLACLGSSNLALAIDSTPSAQAPSPIPTPTPALSISKITAIPPHVNIAVEPGDTIQETLKVKNDSGQDLVLKVQITDFIVTDNKGTPQPIEKDLNNRWALAKWISVSPSSFVIKTDETLPLAMTIQVPVDALPGGHYAMVTYEPSTEGMLNATGSKIAQKVGSLINVTVAGDINEDAQVLQFKASSQFSEYGPIDLMTEIRNLSDVHITPSGLITIYNMLNKPSAELKLNTINIFPLTSRVYDNTFEGKWRLGRYKAELKAGYGQQGQMLTALIYFWIIPWKLILFALLILSSITTSAIYLKKQSKKKMSKEVEVKAQKKVAEILNKKENKPEEK